MQYSQQPQALASHGTPTISPSFKFLTPGTSSATYPIASWPGINGRCAFTGQSPLQACRSVWQTPQAITFTNTWFSPGIGIATSSIWSISPKPWATAAFIYFWCISDKVKCQQKQMNDYTGGQY